MSGSKQMLRTLNESNVVNPSVVTNMRIAQFTDKTWWVRIYIPGNVIDDGPFTEEKARERLTLHRAVMENFYVDA